MAKRPVDYKQPATPSEPRIALWRERGVVLVATIILLLIFTLALSGPSWALVLYRLLTDVPLLLLWLISALGYGLLLPLPACGEKAGERGLPAERTNRPMRLVTAVALGLGILSLLTLLLGLVGFINPFATWTFTVIGAVPVIARLIRITRRATQASPLQASITDWLRTPVTPISYLWLALLPLAAIILVSAFVPPGILWGDEPHGYDVLSYHLQLPREWYEARRITTAAHNVFSFMPLAVETHYLIAMNLRGGPWSGMYLAQLMHVAFCALAVAVTYAIAACAFAESENPNPRATLAAVAAAATPWPWLLAPVAYNEGGLVLNGTLAIGWSLLGLRTFSIKSLILAGVFAGFASTTKLTAVPTLMLAIPIALLSAHFLPWHGRLAHAPAKPLALGAALFLLTSLAIFSPWLGRTAVAARGNPVFPEAQPILGRAHFTPDQSERWTRAHSPAAHQRSIPARLRAFGYQILIDKRYGYLLFPLALLCAALTWRNPATRFLLSLLVLLTLFWLTFTHLQSRFFILAIPICALLIAHLPDGLPSRGAFIVISLMILLSTIHLGQRYTQLIVRFRDAQALGLEDFTAILPEQVAEAVKSQQPVTLVGDAQAFRYSVPMSRLRYRTVFDVNATPGQDAIDAWTAGAPPDSLLIIDASEIDRLSGYYAMPPLPQDLAPPRDVPIVRMPSR